MLVYEKIVDGKQVLYATLANTPAAGDQPAVVMSGETDITANIIWGNSGTTKSTLVVDNGEGGFKVKVGDTWYNNCALKTAEGEDIIPYENFVAAQLAQDAVEESPVEEPTDDPVEEPTDDPTGDPTGDPTDDPTGDAGAGEGEDTGDDNDLE